MKNTQKMKIPESSRSLSPNEKNVKCSKLVVTATNKTIFKSELKKRIFFITSVADDVIIASKRYN